MINSGVLGGTQRRGTDGEGSKGGLPEGKHQGEHHKEETTQDVERRACLGQIGRCGLLHPNAGAVDPMLMPVYFIISIGMKQTQEQEGT